MTEYWMVFDQHECPRSSHVHTADALCVDYARVYSDRYFLDHCGSAVGNAQGDPPEQCSLPALHDGPCKP